MSRLLFRSPHSEFRVNGMLSFDNPFPGSYNLIRREKGEARKDGRIPVSPSGATAPIFPTEKE
jgi:hypothetical protein